MGVKMNLRVITKSHATDPEIVFPTKSISKLYDRGTAISTAWELNFDFFTFIEKLKIFRNHSLFSICRAGNSAILQ